MQFKVMNKGTLLSVVWRATWKITILLVAVPGEAGTYHMIGMNFSKKAYLKIIITLPMLTE